MSKALDLLDILKEIEAMDSLIKSLKGTIGFVEGRLQKMTANDDEERLKTMGEAAAHDLQVLEPRFAKQKEKYTTLLELVKTDSKAMGEIETLKVPEADKKVLETLKQDLLAQSGYEKSEE